MATRRVTVFNNRTNSDGKLVLVAPNTDYVNFLYLAGEKLNVAAKIIYSSTGANIQDIERIRDGEILYISAGEPFQGGTANGSNGEKNGSSAGSGGGDTVCPTYSIAVMGPGSVGKSAMTLRYVQGVFVRDYDPTIEDAYRKNAQIDGDACVLDILDTAGQEDFIALRSTWMRERDAFILVFSVIDRSTFESLSSFFEQLSTMHEDNIPPILVVGNKCDLVEKRQVKTVEGRKLADSFNGSIYLETSAKTGENIDSAFAELVRSIRKENAPSRKEEGGRRKHNYMAKLRKCTIL